MILRENGDIYKGTAKGTHVLIKRRLHLPEGFMEVSNAIGDFHLEIKEVQQGHQWVTFQGERSNAFIMDAQLNGKVAIEYIKADNTVLIKEEPILEEEYFGVSFYPRRERIGCKVVSTYIYPISYYDLYLCVCIHIAFKP